MTQRNGWAELRSGWAALAAATIGVATGVAALPYNTQGLFVGALNTEFHWSRGLLSTVVFAGGVVLAICSPLVGVLIDRFGVRLPTALSYFALVLGFLALSMMHGAFAVFLALQLGLLALGAATGPVSFTRVVSQHFSRVRGFALGCTLGGAGAMALLGTPAVAHAIQSEGWRAGYRLIAAIIAVGGLIAGVLLAIADRKQAAAAVAAPEPGLVPAPPPAVERVAGRLDPDIAGARAPIAALVRSALLWRLAAIFFLLAVGVGGFVFHMVPLLTDAGLPLISAAKTASLIGLAMIVGRLCTGMLVDRFFAPAVAGGIMVVAALGLGALAVEGPSMAAVGAFMIGFAMGTEGDVIGYLTARYFPLHAYGRLYGILFGIYTLGLGFGPLAISMVRARTGSYVDGLWLSAALLLIGALLLTRLPSYVVQE